ncbi:MAG: hypothetical protein WBH09_08225 [Rugosibacter sp.]
MASVAEVQIAEQNAADALTNVRGTLVLALQKIDSYIEKLSTPGSLARKAEMLNWTLNQLAISITPNLRLDLIDNAQAMVTRLAK